MSNFNIRQNCKFILSLIVTCFLFLNSPLPCFAANQIEHKDGVKIPAHQWDVLDIVFQVDRVPDHPFDVSFSAVIEKTNGKRFEVSGFFNGGNQYLLRFTPPAKGDWRYVTKSSLSALNGKKGVIVAQPAKKGRKGAIVVNRKSPREFQYENGQTYYPIAFESDWLFALDAETPDDIPVTRKFVDTLAKNGFNQIVMNVFAYDVTWKKDDKLTTEFEYGSPKVFPFGGNNTKPDYSILNVEYFKRLDRVIEYLDQKGIASHLMIYVWNKRVNWPKANSEADNRYFDYVVKRYQAFPNIVWDISKEALGYGRNDVNYIHQRIDRLRKLDAFKRLLTVHDYSYCRRFSEKLDFISVQLWHSELYSTMRKVCVDFPGQPILNIEHGGYEEGPYEVFTGNYTSAETCLERAYQCVFAGTYPTHYWQCAAWNVIIPDIDAMKPEEKPRFEYYRYMSQLVEKYNLGHLKAGEKVSSSGFCLHNNKDLFIYYVPKENMSIGVRLPKSIKGVNMSAVWFNPLDGKYSEPVIEKIRKWPSFQKPDEYSFVILIVKILPNSKN